MISQKIESQGQVWMKNGIPVDTDGFYLVLLISFSFKNNDRLSTGIRNDKLF